MSFIGKLFGGGDDTPAPTPQPVQATPTISDAASQSAAMAEASRLSSRYGSDQTLLTKGLGDRGSSETGNNSIKRVKALGGDTSLTPTS